MSRDDGATLAIQTVYRPYRTYGQARTYTDYGAYGKSGSGGGEGLSPDAISALVGGAAGLLGPLIQGIGAGKRNKAQQEMLDKQIYLEQVRASQAGKTALYLGLSVATVGALAVLGWVATR